VWRMVFGPQCANHGSHINASDSLHQGPIMTTSFSIFQESEHQSFTLGDGLLEAVLIHGFPGTPAELRPMGDLLPEAGWTVHAPLLPGFGPGILQLAETRAANWLATAHAAWGRIPVRKMGIYRPSVLIGYSLGAALAVQIAAVRPPDFLILVSPFWRLHAGWQGRLLPLLRYTRREFRPYQDANLDDPKIRTQVQRMLPDIDLTDPAVQSFLRDDLRLPAAVVDDVRKVGVRAYHAAPEVTSPTLVIQGVDDDVASAQDARALLVRLGGPVAYHELPGDHEILKIEDGHAGQAYNLIRSFLTGN
jgi:carboxylesterase